MISFIGLVAPLSAFAYAGGEVLPGLISIILWAVLILFYGSILSIAGYTILYLFARDKRKKRIITIALVVLCLSFLALLFIYVTDHSLCDYSQF